MRGGGPACAGVGCGLAGCRALRARECAALEVAHGLLDFLPRVHHERAVLHDGLAQAGGPPVRERVRLPVPR